MSYPAIDNLLHGILCVFLAHVPTHEPFIRQGRRRETIFHHPLLWTSIVVILESVRDPVV
jgi:hypothetical protein